MVSNKRRPSPVPSAESAAEDVPVMGRTSYIFAVLAALVGFFFSQLRELYIELNKEGDTRASAAEGLGRIVLPLEEPSGRGIAVISVDWEAERRFQRRQEQQQQKQHGDTRTQEPDNQELADERVDSVASIAKKYVERNEPFVCRQCMMPESLGGWWDMDANLLEVIGEDTSMPIRVAQSSASQTDPTQFQRSTKPDTTQQTMDKSAYQERNMTASDFFAGYEAHSGHCSGESEHWYAAQIDVVEGLPGLLKYVASSAPPKHQLLESVGPTPPSSHHPVTLYFGKGERTTQLHYDSLENVVCLASGGTKTFSLYDPVSSSKYLYIDRSAHGNFAPANPEDPGPNHPMAKFALASTAVLSTGDCLYLPVYWYHTVTSSEERTISINWWRSPNTKKMSMLESIFCGRNDYGAGAKC